MAATRRRSAAGAADPAALLDLARRGEPLPVLILSGRDGFSRDAVVADLRALVVTEGLEPFNESILWGEEVSGHDLAGAARMMPMGGGRRFILVRRADRIREKEIEPVAEYAGNPSPEACVVFVFDEGRSAARTALSKHAVSIDFPAPRDYQLARWLEAQARRIGVALEPDAARGLAELSGEDYIGAMSELRRAALGAPKGRVTRRVIEELASRGRDTNAFHLADAILSREAPRAVRIARDLHETGMTGYAMIGLLAAQLRRTLALRAQMAGGAAAAAVVSKRSPTLPPEVRARLARQLESFDETRLVRAFRAARAADRAIKSHGSGSELGHLETLIWRIAAL